MGRRSTPKAEVIPAAGNYLEAQSSAEPGSKGAIVANIMQTLDIARRTNPNDIESLYSALKEYLAICMETNISVTNRSVYNALGVSEDTVRNWLHGRTHAQDPRYKEFAQLIKNVCAQYRELAGAEGKLDKTLTIWWQKAYDGFTDNPLPDKSVLTDDRTPADPEEIAAKYKHLLNQDAEKRLEAEREKRSVDIRLDDEEEEQNNG